MKKVFLLFVVSIVALSCSLNNDDTRFYYEILPVESYEVPESFNFGEIYTLKITYKKPTECHTEQTLYFEKLDTTRTVAVQSLVLDRNNCDSLPDAPPIEGTFRFEVLSTTPYLFKFYKGKDENGENIFEEVAIPVNN